METHHAEPRASTPHYSESSASNESETTASFSGEVGAGGQLPLIFKGETKLGAGVDKKRGEATVRRLALNPRAAAISQLRATKCPLVIDDFHYLDREFQGNVIRALKPIIFDGLPVVLIAIPHRRFDTIKVEREITGRLQPIAIPGWSEDELLQIAKDGFPFLNISASREVVLRLAAEAYESPHLMQDFCRMLANDQGVKETSRRTVSVTHVTEDLFSRVAEQTGKVIFDKLAKGPTQRSDRIPRKLKDGRVVDIYKVVLLGLAKLSPGLQTVEYEQLRGAIRDILEDQIPAAHEVTRVVEKMAEIASSDEASTPVLDWEKGEKKLHITDPFFAFFLKWGVNI